MALSSDQQLPLLLLIYGRVLARLRGESAMLHAVMEELRISHPELDGLNLEEKRREAESAFFEMIETVHPGFSAQMDDRTEDQV